MLFTILWSYSELNSKNVNFRKIKVFLYLMNNFLYLKSESEFKGFFFTEKKSGIFIKKKLPLKGLWCAWTWSIKSWIHCLFYFVLINSRQKLFNERLRFRLRSGIPIGHNVTFLLPLMGYFFQFHITLENDITWMDYKPFGVWLWLFSRWIPTNNWDIINCTNRRL